MAGRDEFNILRLIEAPGPVDDYYLYRMDGREMLSTPFEFRLTVRTRGAVPAAAQWIGASITFVLGAQQEDNRRKINGQCVRFEHAYEKGVYTEFVLDITASAAGLRMNRDNRIFSKQNVKDVVSTILKENNVEFDDSRVKGATETVDYIVQYEESDFEFISRLMEREGIFYYFRYDETTARYKHKMYLADDESGFFDGAVTTLSFRRDSFLMGLAEAETSYSMTSSGWLTHDYDYKNPKGLSPIKTPTRLDYASKTGVIYEWPGGGPTPDGVRRRSKTAMEEAESATLLIEGSSGYFDFTPGARFDIDDARLVMRERRIAIRSVTHAVWDPWGQDEGEASYNQSFTAVPSQQPYRPPSTTPRAVVRGPQTAVVLDQNDPEGYGRVQVRFHWDRHGASTCWLRVAQQWGGGTLGAQWIPRPGWEVLVDFLEGDPDRPLVVGSVYNGDNKPPFPVPANLSQSGWRTRTHPDGGVVNVFQFEDKAGAEEIYTSAGRNLRRDTLNDESVDIRGQSTLHVGKDETTTIDGGVSLTIGKDRTEKVGGEQKLTVGGTSTTQTGGDFKVHASGIIELDADGSGKMHSLGQLTVTSEQGINLRVGASTVSITPAGVKITAPLVEIN